MGTSYRQARGTFFCAAAPVHFCSAVDTCANDTREIHLAGFFDVQYIALTYEKIATFKEAVAMDWQSFAETPLQSAEDMRRQITDRAVVDDDFRSLLVTNPKQAISQE
ncbi:MAG: hypothetical protein OXE57_15115, partial [Alphaproteobacteria bacterium]|nr:hypothetical protein [Alphaproteobacteria bacterium]